MTDEHKPTLLRFWITTDRTAVAVHRSDLPITDAMVLSYDEVVELKAVLEREFPNLKRPDPHQPLIARR